MTSLIAPDGPARDAATVTPSDSVDLTDRHWLDYAGCRALYIGVAGNVAVITTAGTTITIPNVPVGVLPLSCTRVLSTGTAASNIIALY